MTQALGQSEERVSFSPVKTDVKASLAQESFERGKCKYLKDLAGIGYTHAHL